MIRCTHCYVYCVEDYGCCPHCGAPLERGDWCVDGFHCGQKIVINKCYGGFEMSPAAVRRYAEIKGLTLYTFKDGNTDFLNPVFIPCGWDEDFYYIHYATAPVVDGKYQEGSYWHYSDIERTDPALVQTVEELGEVANGPCSELTIIEIPQGLEYDIEEYDGVEWVAEKHRTWR